MEEYDIMIRVSIPNVATVGLASMGVVMYSGWQSPATGPATAAGVDVGVGVGVGVAE